MFSTESTRSNGAKRKGSVNDHLGVEPFPPLAEEDSFQVPRYDGQDKNVAIVLDGTQSSETTELSKGDLSQDSKRTPSGQVRASP